MLSVVQYHYQIYLQKGQGGCMKLNIKKKRLKKKLSIRELEELSGVSRTTISRLENGKIPKSLLELEALANALEVNIKSFFR